MNQENLKYESHTIINQTLNSRSWSMISSHILHPTRVTGHSKTLIFYWNFKPFASCTPLNSNISETVLVNIALMTFFKEYLISFLMVCRLIDLALMVRRLLIFKGCWNIGISKIEFFIFPVLKLLMLKTWC